MAWPRRLVRTVSCFQWPVYVSGSYAEYGVELKKPQVYSVCACLSWHPVPLPHILSSQKPSPRQGPHRMNSWKAFTTCLVASGMCTVSKGDATAHVPPLYLPSRQPTVLSSPSTPTPTRNSHLLRYSVCRRECSKDSLPSTGRNAIVNKRPRFAQGVADRTNGLSNRRNEKQGKCQRAHA